MRRLAGLLALPAALAAAAPAPAARTVDAPRALTSGPVLAGDAVVWAEAAGGGAARVVAQPLTGGARRVLAAHPAQAGPSGTRLAATVAGLSAGDGRVAYTLAHGPGGDAGSRLLAVPVTGGRPQMLAACPGGVVPGGVALGDGFALLRGCAARTGAGQPPAVAPVTLDGVALGTTAPPTAGGGVAAAGPIAAWRDPGGGVAVLDRGTGARAVPVPTGASWTVDEAGTVVSVAAAVGSASIAVTPRDGASTVVAAEPRGVLGLTAARGTIAYATPRGAGEQEVVALRDGARRVVARLWPAGSAATIVDTDGARVAWASARCGGTRITVAALGEPPLDQRGAPCPMTLAGRGRLARRALTLRAGCDPLVPPATCTGRLQVRARGATIAAGTVRVGPRGAVRLPLTAAGRRLARRARAVTATVRATRIAAGRRIAATARVRLTR
ncbi:MAG: hypothetical protein IRZ32_09840 [Solirubrobacteraceae bacterium]|nr:hypothetical protein [Solirubrobacteraceae bacterium]